MRGPLTIIAAIGLLGSAFTSPPVGSSDPSGATATPAVAFKAHGDSAVAIDAAAIGGPSTTITVIVPRRSSDVTVSTSVRGVESAPVDVDVGPSGRATVELPGVSTSRGGSLRVELTGVTADGSDFVAVDEVWFAEAAGRRVVSDVGAEDLRFRVDEVLGRSQPEPTVASDEFRVGDRTSTPASAVVSESDDCVAGRVCASGTARWTDRNGAVHPVRSAYVDLVEIVSRGERVRATVLTDDAGRFDAGFTSSIDADVFVRLRAAGPGFDFVVEQGGSLRERVKLSAVHDDVSPGSSVTASFDMGNAAPDDTVFSLHAAMTYATEYLPTLSDSPIPDVEIVFPARNTFYDPSTRRVNMLGPDRWDWDVMLHEYGHFVASELGIEDNPGGPHSASENLGDRLPKDQAIRLAWGEGWPTYFAVSTLFEAGAAALGIPGIGDTEYQDTEDTFIRYDLEDSARLGEDNEVTVSNALWDLYDVPVDGADRTALGARGVWNTLDLGDPVTFSQGAALFTPDRGARRNDVNCVLTQMNVSPELSGPVSQAMPVESPELVWNAGNGGARGRNDRFVVEYRDIDSTVVLFASTTTDTTYRAPQADWERLAAESGGAVNVSVTGTAGGRAPVTGPYRSCARTFTNDVERVVDDVVVPLVPTRYLDTRPGESTFDGVDAGDGRRRAGQVARIRIAGRGAVGDQARAVVVNLTAVRPSGDGFVTAFDCSVPMPPSSSLNHVADVDVANEVVVSLNGDGEICFFTAADTDLVADVVGYVERSSRLVTVAPARLLETRAIESGTTDGRSDRIGRLRADSQVTVRIAGRAGVAEDAAAAVLNVAAVDPDSVGFVTVHPCESSRPLASSLNVVPGVDRADEIIAPLDASGNVCLYTSGATDAIIDVVGYVPTDTDYTPLTPVRLVDTRPGERTVDGDDQGEGRRDDREVTVVRIAGRGGVPTGADAVVAYVTAVDASGPGYVTVWPCNDPRPLASSVNLEPGADGGNEVIAQLDDLGRLCMFTRGATHLTVDVAGYVAD